jgi:hypothetical protein
MDTTETTSLDRFRTMCQRHDLTYNYSDDGSVWRRGEASLAEVLRVARTLPLEDVARIWNEVVDTKLVERARPQFYWRNEWVQS